MHKRYGILSAVTLMFASMLHADGANTMTSINDGGGTVGFAYSTLISGGGLVQVGYTNECMTFDIGGNVMGTGFRREDRHGGSILGHLGYRTRAYQDLFFSIGAMGLGEFYKSPKNQWSTGLFTGLDYQLNQHFMIQGKVYPYNYDHRVLRAKNNFFSNATISFLYVF